MGICIQQIIHQNIWQDKDDTWEGLLADVSVGFDYELDLDQGGEHTI